MALRGYPTKSTYKNDGEKLRALRSATQGKRPAGDGVPLSQGTASLSEREWEPPAGPGQQWPGARPHTRSGSLSTVRVGRRETSKVVRWTAGSQTAGSEGGETAVQAWGAVRHRTQGPRREGCWGHCSQAAGGTTLGSVTLPGCKESPQWFPSFQKCNDLSSQQ